MRYASGEQTERREFLRLDELFLKADPLRNVVHQDQTPDPVSGFSNQRRNRHVDNQIPAAPIPHGKLVQAGDSFLAGSGRNFSRQIGREHFVELSADGLVTRHSNQTLDLRVPRLNRPVEIDREHTHVERFDDVFREVFQPLNLGRFLLERGVELGIIESDGQITGDCQQKFDVFGGKEVAVHGLSQAEHGDGVVANLAGNEIIQVELFKRLPDRRGGFARGASRFVEQNAAREGVFLRVQKTQIEWPRVTHADGPRQAVGAALSFLFRENRQAVHQQRLRNAVHHRSEHGVEPHFGSERAAELDECPAIVETVPVKELIQARLNPVTERLEQKGGHDNGDDSAHHAGRPGRMEQRADQRNEGDVYGDYAAARHGISKSSLENNVHIHQPVTVHEVPGGKHEVNAQTSKVQPVE